MASCNAPAAPAARRAGRSSGRSVGPLAHPAHRPFPHPLPARVSRRGAAGSPRGGALVRPPRRRAAPAARCRGSHPGRRRRCGERVHHGVSHEPHHDFRHAARGRPRPLVLRQLAASRHDARAHARLSPRPHEGDLERAAARVRPRSRTVPQRVSAELGDRGTRDVLRVAIHERWPGAEQLPHAGARRGSRGRRLALAVGRPAVHALGRRHRPVCVRQPLPAFAGRRRGRLGGAALGRGDVGPADPVPRGTAGGPGRPRAYARDRVDPRHAPGARQRRATAARADN